MSIHIQKAWELAIDTFAGKFRRDGITPYIKHVEDVERRVVERNRDCPDLEYKQILAILHDVVEDTKVTFEDILNAGFTPRVVDDLRLLTKKKGQPYPAFIGEMLLACPYVSTEKKSFHGLVRTSVVEVKICDILSNLADSPTDRQILKYAYPLTRLVDTVKQG